MKVAVAGGGLGGLAAALALARTGCGVELIERAPALSEAGAGIQLSPNATRALRSLGVLARIETDAVAVGHVRVRRSRDGAEIARLPLGAAAERRYGAPFLVAHRADVQAALLAALAMERNATLTLGAQVTGFAAEGGRVRVSIRRADGERTATVDGLVGADGLRSAVRAVLVPGAADAPRFSGRTAWRSLVPAEAAPPGMRDRDSQLWLGPSAHLVHYPVRGGRLINVVAVLGGADPDGSAVEGWSAPGDPRHVAGRFRDWCPAARSLIEAAPEWRVWRLYERPPLRRWSKGAVTLLGDAAHPMLPFLAQGAAQAIEDGWALGQAAGACGRFADAAAAYERARVATAVRAQRESSRQGTVYHLAGPFAAARDAVMARLGPERMLRRYDWLYGRAAAP